MGAQLLLDTSDMNVGGKVLEQQTISKNVVLERGKESDGFLVGAILPKSQTAFFEMEVQDRSGWNNSNTYYCYVKDNGTKKPIGISGSLPVIDTSHFQNVKQTSGSSRLSSGTRSWALRTNDTEGGIGLYQVVCGGHQWGGPTGSLFVRVKKTIYD